MYMYGHDISKSWQVCPCNEPMLFRAEKHATQKSKTQYCIAENFRQEFNLVAFVKAIF